MAVLNAQVLSQQVALLSRGGPEAEGAARFLLRASLCGRQARDAALRAGAVTAILPYLRPNTPSSLLQLLAQTFSNFCRHAESEPPSVEFKLVLLVLPLIKDLLKSEDHNVLEAACGAIMHLTYGGSERVRAAWGERGLAARLGALLVHDTLSVKKAALDALGNMLAADNAEVTSYLGPLTAFLREGPPVLARGAARAAANILAQPASIQSALDSELLSALGSVLTDDGDTDSVCQELAARALGNLCYFGTAVQRSYFTKSDTLKAYCAALAADGAVSALVLAGLNVLLRTAERHDSAFNTEIRGFEKILSGRLYELGVLDLTEQLLKQSDKEMQSEALQLQTTVQFYARGENIIYEGGKVFTVAGILEGLGSAGLPRARGMRAARRLLCRARLAVATPHVMLAHGQYFMPSRLTPLVQTLAVNTQTKLFAALDAHDCPDVQYDAACVLSICYSTVSADDLKKLPITTVIPKLVALVGKGGAAVTPAARALGSLSRTHDQAMVASGLAQALLPHLRSTTPLERLRVCFTTYSSVIRCMKPADAAEQCASHILDLFTLEDLNLQMASWRLFRDVIVTEEGKEAALAVPGLPERLVALLGQEGTVREQALRTVADFLAGNHEQKERCLDAGCLEQIVKVFGSLECKRKTEKRNNDYWCDEQTPVQSAALAAATVFRGTPAQIQRALDAGLLDLVLKILKGTKYCNKCQTIAMEASCELCVRGSAAQRRVFMARGGLQVWAANLWKLEDPLKQVPNALDALLQDAGESGEIKATRSRLKQLKYVNKNIVWAPEVGIEAAVTQDFPSTAAYVPNRFITPANTF